MQNLPWNYPRPLHPPLPVQCTWNLPWIYPNTIIVNYWLSEQEPDILSGSQVLNPVKPWWELPSKLQTEHNSFNCEWCYSSLGFFLNHKTSVKQIWLFNPLMHERFSDPKRDWNKFYYFFIGASATQSLKCQEFSGMGCLKIFWINGKNHSRGGDVQLPPPPAS